jgi:predicted MFS family arabinose efflux permease
MGAYYHRYLAAATLARLGDAMWLGVVLLVLARTHDAALAGATLSAATLPTLISAPLLGAWLDRTPHRRAALALNQVMLATCLIGLLALAGRGPVLATLACASLAGLTQPLVTGGMSSMIPALVAPERVPRACAAESVTYDVAEVAGPALAGGIAAAVSPAAALVTQASVALAALVLVARLPPIAPPAGAAPDLRSALAAGMRALVRSRPLRSATLVSVLVAGAGGLLALAIPELARQLTGSVSAAGLLFAVMAVGSTAGAALLPRAQRCWATHRIVLGAALAEGIAWGTLALAGPRPLAYALLVLAGLASGLAVAAVFAVRTACAPERVRAQVFTSAAGLKVGASAIGTAASGVLVGAGGPAVVLGAAAATCAVAVGAGALAAAPARA